jgi:tetratricopeptide (TPR) repeat protein
MATPNPKAMFISYRRANKPLALAIFQQFAPDYDVFLDERSSDNSSRLSAFISRQIKARPYFIMLITPSALHGHYFDNLFWREAKVALRHKRVIIPFVIHPDQWYFHRHYLMPALAQLARHDGIPLTLDNLDDALIEIRQRLNHVRLPSEVILHTIPVTDANHAQSRMAQLAGYPRITAAQIRSVDYYEYAYTAQFNKQPDMALAHYTEAIWHNPHYADAYLARAGLQSDATAHLHDLNSALQHDPQFADAYLARGNYHYALGDYPHAIDDYTHAIAINPNYAPYYISRGNCYLALHDDDRAGDDFDQAVLLENADLDEAIAEPNYQTMRFTATDFYQRGVDSLHKGDVQFALKDLTDSIYLYADNPQAFFQRGNAYAQLGDYPRALMDYHEALRLNPYDDKVYVARGMAYIQTGDYSAAIADFSHAIRLNPTDPTAYQHRGALYHRREAYAQAIADFDQAIRLNPTDPTAYNNRGLTYRILGKLQQAIDDYTEAIRLNPNYAYAYNNRGYAYALLGDYHRALSDYDRALDLMPSYTVAWQNRMSVWKKMRGMS